jgi:hypothetical protein
MSASGGMFMDDLVKDVLLAITVTMMAIVLSGAFQ